MRLVLALAATGFLLAGCQQEPDFDERFDKAQEKTSALAKDIDRQIGEKDAPDTAPPGEPEASVAERSGP